MAADRPATRIPTRPRPHCGHARLAECPLTSDDWSEVFTAFLAFRFVCAVIAERAHDREAAVQGTGP